MRVSFKGGFTLIEMLVVISIIAVLAAMLSPTLMKSLEAAKSLQCLNNQKQLFYAKSSYVDDFKGWSYAGWQSKKYWLMDIFGEVLGAYQFSTNYVDNKDVGFCPSQYPYKYVSDWKSKANGEGACYGFNINQYYDANSKGGSFNYFFKPSSLPTPSKQIWFADSCIVGSSWESAGVDKHDQSDMWYPTAWINNNWRRGIHLRHSNRANCTFQDGHARSLAVDGLMDLGVTKMILPDYEELDM